MEQTPEEHWRDLSERILTEIVKADAIASRLRTVKSQLKSPPTITIGSDPAEQNQSPPRADAGWQLQRDSSPHSSYPE